MQNIHTELFSDQALLHLGDDVPVVIMGILNLSPESFYQDSYISTETLAQQITHDINNGAKILDLGARSTAPWSDPITIEEETSRIQNALEILPNILPPNIIISIDTQYSQVARLALEFGKNHNIPMIINDISSFQTDPELLNVVVEYDCPIILMATNKKPGDAKSPQDIIQALRRAINKLLKKNFNRNQIIIDPGIGKWVKDKTYQYDLAILDQMEKFRYFQCPILIGLSRKSFIGTVLDEKEPKNRNIGSLASTAIAVYKGAHIIRTHDVDKQMMQTIRMAEAIRPKKPTLDEDDVLNRYSKDYNN